MKPHHRLHSLLRSPRLLWDIAVRGRYDFTYDLMPLSARHMSLGKRLNLLRAGANLAWRRPRAWSWPLHMQFEWTNYCNLRCPVCPTGTHAHARPAQPIDIDLFAKVYREVGTYLLTASLWVWGESLLHPELKRLLQIAASQPVATILSTNGQNLADERVIEALIEHPPAHLIVCLDGLTDEVNARYRVGAKLSPALAGVRRLAELKRQRRQPLPTLHMRFIVMEHNEHQVPQLPAFAAEHQFELLTLRTLSIVDAEETAHKGLVPGSAQYRAYEYQDGQRRRRRGDFVCFQPFWFPSLLADGTVVGCDQDARAQLPMGRVSATAGFETIWHGTNACRVRQRIRDHPATLSFCEKCPYADRPHTNDCTVEVFQLADLEPGLASLALRGAHARRPGAEGPQK